MNQRTLCPPGPLPLPLALWALSLLWALIHAVARELPLSQALPLGLLQGLASTAVLWLSLRGELLRTSVLWLALPYALFIPGWLNLPTALLLGTVLLASLWQGLRTAPRIGAEALTLPGLLAFVLLLAWVHLAGIGGYGYQTPDWFLHNARLHDLTERPWPIRYGADQNLVYYTGYFLPAAAIGKLADAALATQALFFWTLLGVVLVLRWLAQLSGWRISWVLAALFILFGPLDLLNLLLLNLSSPTPLLQDLARTLQNTDYLDFRSRYAVDAFIGNGVSNTFQLFWSPQQVIAGWLGIALLTQLFLMQRFHSIALVYALLCLWCPLIMLALLPFLLLTAWECLRGPAHEWLSFANVAGATALAIVFVVYYFSGGTSGLPYDFLPERVDLTVHLLPILVFYLCLFGLYVLALLPTSQHLSTREKRWYACLFLTLLLLPTQILGAFSDLLCRGSAPLMFLLLVLSLRGLAIYRQHQRRSALSLLALLLILGSGSALLQHHTALLRYGQQKPTATLIHYPYAYENLGADESLFNRWFRKALPDAE